MNDIKKKIEKVNELNRELEKLYYLDQILYKSAWNISSGSGDDNKTLTEKDRIFEVLKNNLPSLIEKCKTEIEKDFEMYLK